MISFSLSDLSAVVSGLAFGNEDICESSISCKTPFYLYILSYVLVDVLGRGLLSSKVRVKQHSAGDKI